MHESFIYLLNVCHILLLITCSKVSDFPLNGFEIQQRLCNLAHLVRDANVHLCYTSGMKSWIAYRTKRIKRFFPDANSIEEHHFVLYGYF